MAPPPPERLRRGRWRLGSVLAIIVCGLLVGPLHQFARASIPLLDDEDGNRFELGGYARSLTGVQVSGLRNVDGHTEPSGLAQSLARVDWKLVLGETFAAEIQHRLALTVGSAAALGAVGPGVGVIPAPSRSLDTSSVLVAEDGLTSDHDLDRFAPRIKLGTADLVLGRQAITWGLTGLFRVSDSWAALSPFDLDTSQKRGLDALRVGLPLSSRVDLDLVLADRGSLEDLSGGARVVAQLDPADLQVLRNRRRWSSRASRDGRGCRS